MITILTRCYRPRLIFFWHIWWIYQVPASSSIPEFLRIVRESHTFPIKVYSHMSTSYQSICKWKSGNVLLLYNDGLISIICFHVFLNALSAWCFQRILSLNILGNCSFQNSWFSQVDQNGQEYSEWLRRDGRSPSKVICIFDDFWVKPNFRLLFPLFFRFLLSLQFYYFRFFFLSRKKKCPILVL